MIARAVRIPSTAALIMPPAYPAPSPHGYILPPEVIRLSLIRGETLVLVSDGISGEETRQRIAGFADRSPKALANYLIASAGDHGEDDRTAIAVCLRPLLSGGTKGP